MILKPRQITEYEKTYLLIIIDKSDEFKNVRKYKKIEIETSVLLNNSNIPISELTNQFGKLQKNEEEKKYTLRLHKTKKFINIQFSCFEEHLEIKIENRNNLIKERTIYGISFYSFPIEENEEEKLILIIKRKNKSNKEDEYFMLKYTNSDEKIKYPYSINNTTIKVDKKELSGGKFNYTIKLNPLDNSNNYNLNYIIRAVYEGLIPNKSDISMKINKQIVKEFYNPNPYKGELIFEIYNITQSVKYIQVIVQILDKYSVEYLSYEIFKIDELKNQLKYDKILIIIVIIMGSIIFILIIILIIIIILIGKKNKKLIDEVNKISFIDSDRKGENLLLGEENDK